MHKLIWSYFRTLQIVNFEECENQPLGGVINNPGIVKITQKILRITQGFILYENFLIPGTPHIPKDDHD